MRNNPEQHTGHHTEIKTEGKEASQRLANLAIEQSIPQEFLPRQYGMEHIFVDLPLRSINALNQVRRGRNDQQTNLEESIEDVGLKSFPEVARLTADNLLAYAKVVDFRQSLNESDDVILARYTKHDDGFYYVIIFGHSRIKAIASNELQRAADAHQAGFEIDPESASVRLLVRDNPTPDQILTDQITENFHSRPPTEAIASDLLGLYRYLVGQGTITTEAEFCDLIGGKLPKNVLEIVLDFGRLPANVQELAFIDVEMPFVTAAKLGSLVPHKYALERMKSQSDPNSTIEDADIQKLVQAYIEGEYVQMASAIHNAKRGSFGVNLQKQRIENERLLLLDAITNQGDTLLGTTLEFWGMTTEQLNHEEIIQIRKRLSQSVEEIRTRPVRVYDEAISLYETLFDIDQNPAAKRARDKHIAEIVRPVLNQDNLLDI